ncbi:MAG: hypothetical protein N4A63_02920 [Vallitalea sp.]|jgi:hypothetical protein|nr:hypothetical protein [Vallitalea sp.]
MSKKGYRIIIGCLLVIVTGLLYSSIYASSGGEPGTIQDPIVTKSYVDEKLDEILIKVNSQKINNTNTTNENTNLDYNKIYKNIDEYISGKIKGIDSDSSNNAANKFKILELEEGTKLICSESSEVILRAGKATIIANETGDGISDLTMGIDLAMGVVVPKNHLLLIPRTDGRGLHITSKSWVMIKGDYRIEDK